MEQLTQAQAEEQCRALMLQRNQAIQAADALYQETIQSLYHAHIVATQRLGNEIIRLKSEICRTRAEMSEVWSEVWNAHKDDEKEPVMGTVVNPFKLKIGELSAQLQACIHERKQLTEEYHHRRSMAGYSREKTNRDMKLWYQAESTKIMQNVCTRKAEYWRKKYEELKAQMPEDEQKEEGNC